MLSPKLDCRIAFNSCVPSLLRPSLEGIQERGIMSIATADSIVYNTPEVNSGTTTSWIPLTTPWPSSSGCASSFFLFPGQPFPYGWDPGLGYFYGQTQRCLPPAVTTWHEQDHQNPDGFTMLSIRPIVCPAAFTTAATSVQSGSSTLVVCCPS
jgi:hypothetical protein